MHRGYIKEYRKIVDWEWYTDVNTCHLFRHCLYKANIEDKKWRGQFVARGSFITSLEHLSHETGLTIRQIRTALDKLKMTNELTIKTTCKNTVITVNNYDIYQDNDKQNDKLISKQMTNERQTNDKQMTTTKECKEYKNDNNEKNINKYIKEEENFLKNSNSQKLDPFINPIAEIYKKEYKEIMGKTCYLNNQHRNKIVELAADIENFKETIPEILKKLKNLKFDNIQNFTPSNTWLLKDDNYIKLLEGAFDKYIQEEEIDGWSL